MLQLLGTDLGSGVGGGWVRSSIEACIDPRRGAVLTETKCDQPLARTTRVRMRCNRCTREVEHEVPQPP